MNIINITSIYYPDYNSTDSIFHGLLNCLFHIRSFCAINLNLVSIISMILIMLFASSRLFALSSWGSCHVAPLPSPISDYWMATSSTLSTKIGIIRILFSRSVRSTSCMLITSAWLYQQDSATTSELTPSTVSPAWGHPQAHPSHWPQNQTISSIFWYLVLILRFFSSVKYFPFPNFEFSISISVKIRKIFIYLY